MLFLKKLTSFLTLLIFLFLFTICLNVPLVNAQNDPSWQKFAGTWQGTNEESMMQLFLTVDAHNNLIYGSHKAIGTDGKRADMVSEGTLSLSGLFLNSTSAKLNFLSANNPNDRGTGTATLTLLDENTLKWQLTSRNGTAYFPYEIELKKTAPAAPEATHVLFKDAWSVFHSPTKKQFTLQTPVQVVTEALGEPREKTLYLDGSMHSGEIYSYNGLEILAENNPTGIIVTNIQITSPGFITPGDLKIGDSAEKMTAIYGVIEKNRRIKEGSREWHTYIVDSKKGYRSAFAVEDGVVKIIRFSLPVTRKY
ncbi:MAG: hypothetical protein LBR56_01230 [Sporomusaceae bacterium]|jgi:hypothetical protein|nr:hypothetical protein [Sporomusaceae bacterium]